MAGNQVFFKRIFFWALFLFFSSCARPPVKIPRAQPPADYWKLKAASVKGAKRKKILAVLDRVLEKSRRIRGLDAFGIRTMNESVKILDESKNASSFIAGAILKTGRWRAALKNSDWRFRYWCVDMAGYLKDRKLAEVLYSVALDGRERPEVRVRAVKSLREFKNRYYLKKLLRRVSKSGVREEIAKAILYLK